MALQPRKFVNEVHRGSIRSNHLQLASLLPSILQALPVSPWFRLHAGRLIQTRLEPEAEPRFARSE